jgi:aldehyde dehydrogenase (NAD+)
VCIARRAFRSGAWRDPRYRRQALSTLANLIESNEEKLRSALIREVGTPISLCKPLQLGAAIAMLRYFADESEVDRTRNLGRDHRVPATESVIRYEPAGVVAAIGSYNYPLINLVGKAGAALAAGCAVVYMPSPFTPLTTLLIGDLANEAGIPPGILNIITGNPSIGAALTSHLDIDRITFTGSVAVGRQIMMQASRGVTGMVLELGGKSAGIVLPGADLIKVAMPLHCRYLRNAGQGCQSPTRLLVPANQLDEFISVSRDAYEKIQVGDPWDPDTVAGPLISEAHRARVEGYVTRSLEGGARVLAGGGRPDIARGWYMNATLIGDVTNDSEIARNELFGPVAVVMPYSDIDEAIEIANASELGLAASIHGPLDLAKQVAQRLEVGTVYINGGGQLRVDAVMGGWKDSGIGKEWGEDGIKEFLNVQHIQWAV